MKKIIILFILFTLMLTAQEKKFQVVGQFVHLGMTKNDFLKNYKDDLNLNITGENSNSIVLSDKITHEINAICDFENNKLVVVNKYWEKQYDKKTIDFSLILYDLLTDIISNEPISLISTNNYSQPGYKMKSISFDFRNSDRSINISIDEKKGEIYIYENYRKMPKY